MSGAADQALRDYIAGNTADGKTNFYSNFYDGRVIVEDGKRLGNTTASFEPSDANSFYYFTEDTPLYTDRECKIPLTKEPTAGQAYYYKRSYYKKGSAGQAEQRLRASSNLGESTSTGRSPIGARRRTVATSSRRGLRA